VVGLRARLIAMLFIVMGLAFLLLIVGVNFGLRGDVHTLAQRTVDSGSSALSSAIASRAENVRATMLQGSAQAGLATALKSNNHEAIASIASDLATSANLSFVVVTDLRGKIIAGNRAASGSLAKEPLIATAASGTLIGGPELLDGTELHALGVAAQPPALAVTTASAVNVNGAAVGVLYGGALIDSTTKALDDVANLTGGQAGIAINGTFVATSIATKEGVKETGTSVGHVAETNDRESFSGEQTVDGVDYYVKISPLTSNDGKVIGAYWFGVPFEQFAAIVNNTLRQILVWGVIGLLIALVVGSFVATRIGRSITNRSDEVNESARQLRVLVVGGEVSGDHVERTRETLKEIANIVSADTGGASAHLKDLAHQAVDDVVVIDTLTAELSTRMRDAATRVERLSAVAQELDELVAGARPSRN